jgi:hypothetical protein
MAKLSSVEVFYRMSSQPRGAYTGDEMSIRATITYEPDEKPNLLEEVRELSGKMKLACHKRIQAAIKETPTEANQK